MRRQSDADEENDFDYLFKLVLIGDPGVGKSALVHRFKYNTFVERHASTIGVDFLIRSLMIDGKKIKVISYYSKEIIPSVKIDLNLFHENLFCKALVAEPKRNYLVHQNEQSVVMIFPRLGQTFRANNVYKKEKRSAGNYQLPRIRNEIRSRFHATIFSSLLGEN